MRGEHGVSGWREPRAQSNVIAVVLLAGLVVAGATVVVVAGSSAINQAQAESSYSTAEQSMRSLGAEIDQVSQSGDPASLELSGFESGDATVEDTGEITITIEKSGSKDSVSQSLGTVQYEQNGRELAYQSGGIFERSENGSTVVSEPPVSFVSAGGDPTLSIPIITVEGASAGGDVQLERTAESELLSKLDGDPSTATSDPMTPLPREATLSITVESEYYLAWGSVFEERTDAKVTYDPDNERVTLKMRTPPETISGVVKGSVISPYGPTSEFANGPRIDSYSGTYSGPVPDNENGDVYAKSMPIKNQGKIYGDLHVQDLPNRIQGNFKVHGETVFGSRGSPSASPVNIGSGGGGKTLEFFGDFSVKDWTKVRRTTFHSDVIGSTRMWLRKDTTVEGSVYSWGRTGSNDVKLKGTVVKGDLYVIGDIHPNKNPEVWGEIYVTGSVKQPHKLNGKNGNPKDPTKIHHKSESWMRNHMKEPKDPKIPSPSSVSDKIKDKESTYNLDNDNGDPSADVGPNNKLTCQTGSVSTCTLTAGDYYLKNIDLDQNDRLELDTTGGDINIYVDNGVDLTKGNIVETTGDNRVSIYTGEGGGDTFKMTGGAKIVNSDDDAKQLWVYMDPDDKASFTNWGGGLPTTEFKGVIYGPGKSGNPGAKIAIKKKVEIYGALVGNLDRMHSGNPKIHYDESLSGAKVFKPASSSGSRIWYLRTTARTVTIE